MLIINSNLIRGYLRFLSAAISIEEFKKGREDFCDELKDILESFTSENRQKFNYKLSIIMKLLAGNPGNKKFTNTAEQRFIEKRLEKLQNCYNEDYTNFGRLLLCFSWDKQYPIGYWRLARLFLGESAISVYIS